MQPAGPRGAIGEAVGEEVSIGAEGSVVFIEDMVLSATRGRTGGRSRIAKGARVSSGKISP